MLNPVLAIPFFVAPACCAIVSWFALNAGLVGRPYVLVPWTLPAPIGAVLAVGDWRAAILVVVNLALAGLIYWPFFRAYDRQVCQREQAAESDAAP